jgi:phospholipid transport system transporter-binding protein
MEKRVQVTFQTNQISIAGDLDFSNVMAVHEKSLLQLGRSHELNVDFSKLHSSDSSGLALLIEWIKLAEGHGKKIHFTHVSDDLMSIAKVAGLNELINGNTG